MAKTVAKKATAKKSPKAKPVKKVQAKKSVKKVEKKSAKKTLKAQVAKVLRKDKKGVKMEEVVEAVAKELVQEEPVTVAEIHAIFSQYGVVQSVGETLLDENGEISSDGERAFSIGFTKLYNLTIEQLPRVYKNRRVRCQVVGKVVPLNHGDEYEDEDEAWDEPIDNIWDGVHRQALPVKAFAREVSKLSQEIKEKLKPGKG